MARSVVYAKKSDALRSFENVSCKDPNYCLQYNLCQDIQASLT